MKECPLRMNPYDWQHHQPSLQGTVLRPEVTPLLERLSRGGSAVILGGRGMGKSVLLRQISEAAARLADTRICLFPGPPVELTAEACLQALARGLEVVVDKALSSREIFEEYGARHGQGRIILLFDELDHYAQGPRIPASSSAGRQFFNDLESARRELPGIGIVAAGSIGVFVFRNVLGSSFLDRAEQFRLAPFDRPELAELARPFTEAGRALDTDTLDALYLASGGNPALATFGLEKLWDERSGLPAGQAIPEIFTSFQERNREFLRDIRQSFSDPSLSEAPQRVWELVQKRGGPVSRADLEEACRSADGTLPLDLIDALHLLAAAGLVRLEGSPVHDDPVAVSPITSILTLPQLSRAKMGEDFRGRFLADVQSLLGRVHAGGADFFRPGDAGAPKQLVHEAVFAGFLALGLGLLGWRVEREAQQAAGRADLKVRRNGGREVAVVEVKIWGRNDYREVHRQLESYWTADTVAGAVVMLTDREIADWPTAYWNQCIPQGVLPTVTTEKDSPIQARLGYGTVTPDEMRIQLDHFLLRLPRRH